MTTAIDTNLLLDILLPDPEHVDSSRAALVDASRTGALIIGEAVYAELAAQFDSGTELERFVTSTGIRLEASTPMVLDLAGRTWRTYRSRRPRSVVCARCGQSQEITCTRCGQEVTFRQHVVADFLIGAHALHHAGRLLTRDRGFYATYFPELELLPQR